jgi:hypothetical protein
VMAEHDEGEEEAAGEGGNEKEVDGGDVASMRGQKGTPRGRRLSRRPVHVLGDGQLGTCIAEQGEFCLDASPRIDALVGPARRLRHHPPSSRGDAGEMSVGRPRPLAS